MAVDTIAVTAATRPVLDRMCTPDNQHRVRGIPEVSAWLSAGDRRANQADVRICTGFRTVLERTMPHAIARRDAGRLGSVGDVLPGAAVGGALWRSRFRRRARG